MPCAPRPRTTNLRRHRYLNRVNAKVVTQVTALSEPSGRPAVRLPFGEPMKRLTALRRLTIEAYAQDMFRSDASGGSSFTVKFAASTYEVDYHVDLNTTSRKTGRGSLKRWALKVGHEICVPADWRLRIEWKGLADLGGMMTLDVLPMDAPDGIALYAAVWACQDWGYSVKTKRGFIAISDYDDCFHAETSEKAIAGLLEKYGIRENASPLLLA